MLLKLSVEAFGGPKGSGINAQTVERIASGIKGIITKTARALVN